LIFIGVIWFIVAKYKEYLEEESKSSDNSTWSNTRKKTFHSSYTYNSVSDNVDEYIGKSVIFSKVTGVTYNNRQENIRKITKYTPIKLETNSSNSYDSNAVQVLTTTNYELGWIPKEVSSKISKALYNSEISKVEIYKILGNGINYNFGLRIAIYFNYANENYKDILSMFMDKQICNDLNYDNYSFFHYGKDPREERKSAYNTQTILSSNQQVSDDDDGEDYHNYQDEPSINDIDDGMGYERSCEWDYSEADVGYHPDPDYEFNDPDEYGYDDYGYDDFY